MWACILCVHVHSALVTAGSMLPACLPCGLCRTHALPVTDNSISVRPVRTCYLHEGVVALNKYIFTFSVLAEHRGPLSAQVLYMMLQGKELLSPGKNANYNEDHKIITPMHVSLPLLLELCQCTTLMSSGFGCCCHASAALSTQCSCSTCKRHHSTIPLLVHLQSA